MTAETKIVSQVSEEAADIGMGVEEQKPGLDTSLPVGIVQNLNEVSHPSANANASADQAGEEKTSCNNDERVELEKQPANEMTGVGGDPDQQSYVFVDSHNGGGGDSSSDWDLNVEEDDADAAVSQTETEVKNVDGDVAETIQLPAQSQKDIVLSSADGGLPPSEEENQNQNVTGVFVADPMASEKEQPPPPHHSEEAAAAAVTEENPTPLVVPNLLKEEDQVESESSPLVFVADNLKSTVTAAEAKLEDALQSHDQEANSSELVLVSDKDKVPEVVSPHDAKDHLNNLSSPITTCTITDCNNNRDVEEDAQVVLVSDEASKNNPVINDGMLGIKNSDEETEVKLDTSTAAEPGVVVVAVQEVREKESLPETAECTSLDVEAVESQTEVEVIPNALSSATESCLLDKGIVDKLELEEGVGEEKSLPEAAECTSLDVEAVESQTEVEVVPNAPSSATESCLLDKGVMEKLEQEEEVKEEESLPEAAECTSLDVEAVESQTEVEVIPNALSSATESCLLDKGVVEKLEREEGVREEESLPQAAECTSLDVEAVESQTELEVIPNALSSATESCLLDKGVVEKLELEEGVREEESLPEAAECASLDVEAVESQTEVEAIPNALSPAIESCLLDKRVVEKLEREEGVLEEEVINNAQSSATEFCLLEKGVVEKLEAEGGEETCFNANLKEHEQGNSELEVDDSSGIKQDIDLEGSDEVAELPHETNIESEEAKLEHVLTDSNASFPSPKPEEEGKDLVTKDPSDGAVECAAAQNNNSSNDDNNLHSPSNSMKPETEGLDGTEVESYIFCSVNNAAEEVKMVAEEVNEISGAIKASDSSCTTINKDESSQPLAADVVDPDNGGLVEDAGSKAAAYKMISNSEMPDSSCAKGVNFSSVDAAVICQSPVQFGSFVPGLYQVNTINDSNKVTCEEPEHLEQVHVNDVSEPLPVAVEFTSPVIEQTVPADVETVERPFNFLIKMPRYYDDQLSEQIGQAELLLSEKMLRRDGIRRSLQTIRVNMQQAQSVFTAALSEERAARRLVRLKRQDIDSVQSVINRVKNAIFVKDIDLRIKNMEHMMQHETLALKEEKQFIREIKQLKHHRDQLSSNMGSQDEVQKALDDKDHIEEKLKTLKKELDHLKNKVSAAEAIAVAAGRKLEDEKKRLQEATAQHNAANDVYQEARTNMQNLRRQFNEKNNWFWRYKDDAKAAYDYASNGDKQPLHRLCVNQVEKFMEKWNNDDEFRSEYMRCNMRSTLWRLKTMDGRALGPDEELPVVPSFTNERVRSSHYQKVQHPSNPSELLVVSDLEKRKQGEIGISTTKVEAASKQEPKSVEKVVVVINEEAEKAQKKPGKPTTVTNSLLPPPTSSSSVGSVVEKGVLLEDSKSEEDNKQLTKEEQELTIKEEELRKAEEEAKLKEQRRLEEIAKAKEALERKKKIAEARALRNEARAQKEAELKEKEKEKRAKKKERKKAGGSDSVSIEGDVTSETETIKQAPPPPPSPQKRPQKAAYFKQYNKLKSTSTIPPALRNRNKKRMQQWIWMFVIVVAVIAVFFLGNWGIGFNFHASSFSHNPRVGNPKSGF